MAEMGMVHRVLKSKEANIKDFYQTPRQCTQALVTWLEKMKFPRDLTVLDPCRGEGAITRVLETYFDKVDSIDLFDETNPTDFLKTTKKYDLIVSNPPYSSKYLFVNHARELADKVLAIFPMQIVNYNMFHRDYMAIDEFVGKIKLVPKIFMHEGADIKYGGASSYAWFFWNKEYKGEGSYEWYDDLRNY